ncbi:MAG: M28 family peptidase [Clostridia bacterium]|nr:M28 family peptidase [Clostridia bacterium]
MKEESRKYVQEAWDIVKHASEKIGSRLPGSKGEREYADYMGDKLREIGIEPKTEEFGVAPRAGIGGIPYAGWYGLIASALIYFALHNYYLWFGMALAGICVVVWLVFSCFLYKPWFDMFFKQKISQNVYGELLPEDGKYDYTIILSGHTDTSWNWKHSENASKHPDKPIYGLITTYGKVGFGAVCVFFLVGLSIAMSAIYTGLYFDAPWAYIAASSEALNSLILVLHFLPVVTAIGSCFVIMWNDSDEETASRGAMDNATGCALSYAVIKYFKENPDKMPKNCRIVDCNCGSEEAGLRGSMAFVNKHKNDDLTKNAWNINIDSVADKEYFEVVIKDDWQGCRFDTDLEKMFKDTFNEMGIESKTNGCIHNPVGGCDSTPMTRGGIKSVTFAAQNPMLTWYYHTFHDMPDRFGMETVGDGFDVVLSVIDKIAAFQEENGFNGPQKK